MCIDVYIKRMLLLVGYDHLQHTNEHEDCHMELERTSDKKQYVCRYIVVGGH